MRERSIKMRIEHSTSSSFWFQPPMEKVFCTTETTERTEKRGFLNNLPLCALW